MRDNCRSAVRWARGHAEACFSESNDGAHRRSQFSLFCAGALGVIDERKQLL